MQDGNFQPAGHTWCVAVRARELTAVPPLCGCLPAPPRRLPQPSEIRWASRWDTYLMMMDDQIHWFSIINSLMIVLFLSGKPAAFLCPTEWTWAGWIQHLEGSRYVTSLVIFNRLGADLTGLGGLVAGMVAMIMMRTLHRDISKYNQLETAEEAQEETGWKLVRARLRRGSAAQRRGSASGPVDSTAAERSGCAARELGQIDRGLAAGGVLCVRPVAHPLLLTTPFPRRCTATCSARPCTPPGWRCLWARACSCLP